MSVEEIIGDLTEEGFCIHCMIEELEPYKEEQAKDLPQGILEKLEMFGSILKIDITALLESVKNQGERTR